MNKYKNITIYNSLFFNIDYDLLISIICLTKVFKNFIIFIYKYKLDFLAFFIFTQPILF